MKKIILFTTFICCFSKAFTQQDKIISETINSLISVDSIIEINIASLKALDKGKISKSPAMNQGSATEDKNKYLQDTIINDLKIDAVKLQKKIDSLQTLTKTNIDALQALIKTKEEAIKEKEKSKQEVLDKVMQTYLNQPFDTLTKITTLETVERDKSILGDGTKAQQVLADLQIYFKCEQVLDKKFDIKSIEEAKNQLTYIKTTTDRVLYLKDKLNSYRIVNDGLRDAIRKILVIDSKEIANGDDFIQERKLNKILPELAWYFRNYHYNESDYPYLTNIVLEIIKKKQKDADNDIATFLDKI